MKYDERLTPHELAIITVKAIENKRNLERIGEKQALDHCMANRDRIQKRLNGRSYGHKRY